MLAADKIKLFALAATVAVLFCFLLTGCGVELPQETDDIGGEIDVSTASTEDVDEPSSETNDLTESSENVDEPFPTASEEPVEIEIETPYLSLYYPSELVGELNFNQTQVDEATVTTFHTETVDGTVELFSIILGPSDDGFLLGYLSVDGGRIAVRSIVYELSADEPNYDRLCSLQERVNDVLMSIYEDERFKAVR